MRLLLPADLPLTDSSYVPQWRLLAWLRELFHRTPTEHGLLSAVLPMLRVAPLSPRSASAATPSAAD